MAFIKINGCLTCGEKHEWQFDSPTLKELRTIKKLTGLSGNQFAEASDTGDPDALAALLYVLHLRDGMKVRFEDIDLDFASLEMVADKEEEAAEAEAEAHPRKKSRASHSTPSGPTSAED